MLLPVLLEFQRHLGVAVAGQIHQAALLIQSEKINQLGAPGVLEVRARRAWVSVFNALDLPALDRPAKATSRPISSGHWSTLLALLMKLAVWQSIARGVTEDMGYPVLWLGAFTFAASLVYNAAVLYRGRELRQNDHCAALRPPLAWALIRACSWLELSASMRGGLHITRSSRPDADQTCYF